MQEIQFLLFLNHLRLPYSILKSFALLLAFHTARHTCATLLCHQGVPITTIQKILGHMNLETTQLYSEVMGDTIVRDLSNAKEKQDKESNVDKKK